MRTYVDAEEVARSTYWNGKSHVACFVCRYCALSYPAADELREHLKDQHDLVPEKL